MISRLACCAILLGVIPAATAAAQRRAGPTLFTLSAGPSEYDLSGSGRTWVVAARTDLPMNRAVILEPGIALFSYRSQSGNRLTFLLPELSLQGQGRVGAVRPFVGGGIGFSSTTRGPNQNELTLHAVAGVRIAVSRVWGVRTELRVRSIDPWAGTTADLTFGISRVTIAGL
jgi:hypothetical protein